MTRTLLTIVLAVVIVFTAGGSVMAGPVPGPTVTVTGQLEYVTAPATPHYEVSGYVLLTKDPAALKALTGQDVVVTGTVSTAPSIYMRKTLEVLSVVPQSTLPPEKGGDTVTIPVMPTEPPKPGDVVIMPVQPGPGDAITIPAIPGPSPAVPAPPVVTVPAIPQPAPLTPGDGVSAPVMPAPAPADPPKDGGVIMVPEPVPLFGTPYWILFGRVEYTGKEFVVVQERMGGDARIPVSSTDVDLAVFAGERSGLVVEPAGAPTDPLRYRAIAGVILTGDLSDRIRAGEGVFYSAPEQPISVLLHGKPVAMDQAPILGNGRTLVGLRAIGEALGARVDWDSATQTATLALSSREVAVTIGSNRVIVRETGRAERVIESDIAPVIVGGRTTVPVRVLAESLGLTVDWEPANRTVILN